MPTKKVLTLLTFAHLAIGSHAQVQVAHDVPWEITPIGRSGGGAWWVERNNFFSPTSRIVLTDAQQIPVAAYELHNSGSTLASNIRSASMPDDRLLVMMTEMQVIDMDNVFTVTLAILDTDGSVVWQAGYQVNEGSGFAATTCGFSTSVEVDASGRIFLMIPRFTNIEDLVCIQPFVGGLQWWKHVVQGSATTTNMIVPDEEGGCYWLQAGELLLHFTASGQQDWSKHVDWMGSYTFGAAIDRLPNGHLRWYSDHWSEARMSVVELDAQGEWVGGSWYGPALTGVDYVQPVQQANGHTLIAGNYRFITVDADGEVLSAFAVRPDSVGISDIGIRGEHALIAGNSLPGPVHFAWELPEDLQGFCNLSPISVTRTVIAPGEWALTASTEYQSDVEPTDLSTGFYTTPIALPTANPYCALGISAEERPLPFLSTNIFSAGSTVDYSAQAPGSVELYTTNGKLLRRQTQERGTGSLSTAGSCAGIYIVKSISSNGIVLSTNKVVLF